MLGYQPPTYPVNLCLQGQSVLVVGGGKVALRKVRGLLAAGAKVTVVALDVTPELKLMADDERLVLHQRPYAAGEARRFHLVFAATGVAEVERQVADDARHAGLWVNVADVPELCSFYLPARIQRGHLQMSITTDGKAPFAARRVRKLLEEQIGTEFTAWIECAGNFREAVLAKVPQLERREELFDRFFAETWPSFAVKPTVPAKAIWRAWIEPIAPPAADLEPPAADAEPAAPGPQDAGGNEEPDG